MFSSIKCWWKNRILATTDDERVEWLESVMREVDEIERYCKAEGGFPEVFERIRYLRARKVVAVPRIDSIGDLILCPQEDSVGDAALFVYPLLRSDASISPVGANYAEHAQPGTYSVSINAIILGMEHRETLRYMATTLIHEVGHAMAAEKEGRIGEYENDRIASHRLEEELRMSKFDCRLVMLLGGQEFMREMQVTVREIIRAWILGETLQVKHGNNTPLDLCYGALNISETMWPRSALYMFYCNLVALNAFFGPYAAYSHQISYIASAREETRRTQAEARAKQSS